MTLPPFQSVSFRVSTDPMAGAGHISRMLALRKVIQEPVNWFVDPGTINAVNELVSKTDGVFEETALESVARLLSLSTSYMRPLVICDSCEVGLDALEAANVPAVYFCDSEIQSCSDSVTVVNCQPMAKSHRNCLSGPRFMPIDTRGKQRVTVDFTSISYPISCLIGFGALDSGNMTAVALEALLTDKELRKIIRPVCLLGPHFNYKDTIQSMLSAFTNPKIIQNCRSVLDIPNTCNIAIGAPGLSHSERLYLGIPTVLVPQSEKHTELCKNWHDEGCALFAGPEPKLIARRVKELVANQFYRARIISIAGQSLIDGEGASRLLSELTSIEPVKCPA